MMLLPLAVAAVSCGKEPVDTAASLSVQPTLLEFAATGNGSQSVAVTATNTEWTHEVSGAAQEWLSASLGEDGKSLLISVTDNPTAEKRSGTVSVKAVDHIEIKPIGITVQQEAGEGVQPGGSITVSPESLTFAGEGAEAQRVAVTVSNPELTWTAAPEDAAKEWITVTADGDGISVSVSDNPETDQRSGNIIITPGLDDVSPRAVRVVQEGKILPPSLDADPKEVPVFAYDGSVERIITVTAVNCDWAVRVDYTEGDAGGWVKAQTIKTEAHSALSISVGRNETLEARSASVTGSGEYSGYRHSCQPGGGQRVLLYADRPGGDIRYGIAGGASVPYLSESDVGYHESRYLLDNGHVEQRRFSGERSVWQPIVPRQRYAHLSEALFGEYSFQ